MRSDPQALHPPTPPHDLGLEVMRMRWDELTFMHWPFDPADVQDLLPDGLVADEFDGAVWVGLVPFIMRVSFPGGLAMPAWVGVFPETNVRTYVRGPDGTPGVYFCSLEAGRLPATATARLTYGLPYFWAEMSVAHAGPIWTYESTRRWPGPKGAHHASSVRVGDAIEATSVTDLEHYLTARWGLFSTWRDRLVYAPVHHPAWELHRAEVLHLDDGLVSAAGLRIPDSEPVVHFSYGTEVRIGRPTFA